MQIPVSTSTSSASSKNKGGHPGGPNRRTRFIAEKLARDGGVTPLEVMVAAMRYHWQRAHIEKSTGKKIEKPEDLNVGEIKEAAAFANMAAPYIHPRLATHEVSGKGGGGIPLEIRGSVTVFLPDNKRRVANDQPSKKAKR